MKKSIKYGHCVRGGVDCKKTATLGKAPMLYCEDHFIPKNVLTSVNKILDRLYASRGIAAQNKTGLNKESQIHFEGLIAGYSFAIEQMEQEFGFQNPEEINKNRKEFIDSLLAK